MRFLRKLLRKQIFTMSSRFIKQLTFLVVKPIIKNTFNPIIFRISRLLQQSSLRKCFLCRHCTHLKIIMHSCFLVLFRFHQLRSSICIFKSILDCIPRKASSNVYLRGIWCSSLIIKLLFFWYQLWMQFPQI